MVTDEDKEYRPQETLTSQAHENVDTLDILLVLARRKRIIAAITGAGLVAGISIAFLLKPNFTANAIVLPPQQQSSSSALLNQLGSLTAFSGGAGALGIKTPADMYVGMLKSRTVADELISKFRLREIYHRSTMQDTRLELKKKTSVEVGKDGMIEISVTDHDPRRASDLANAYVEQLDRLNASLAISEAAQRRLFFDRQLETERKQLANAEEALQNTQQQTGLIQINGQADLILQSITRLRAEIASREVEMRSLQSFATEQNPDVIRLEAELSTMRAQLSSLEKDQKRDTQPGDTAIPSGTLPKDALDYTRKLREVKYHESLFDLLSKQQEAARIDEAKSAPIIQVVDHALPPDKKSGPPRLLIVLGSVVFAFLLGSALAIAEYALERLRRRPHQRVKLEALRTQLWRSR